MNWGTFQGANGLALNAAVRLGQPRAAQCRLRLTVRTKSSSAAASDCGWDGEFDRCPRAMRAESIRLGAGFGDRRQRVHRGTATGAPGSAAQPRRFR